MTRLLTKIRVLVIDENVATHNDYRKILTLNDQTSHAIAAIKTSVFGESPISSINLPDISIDATTDAQQGVQMIRRLLTVILTSLLSLI
ncbi:MAG: hypothetical protein HWD59_10925 [Coxiellaceae bacterium]|nr:MAG: hypothetical protein HWD59_10925 [Coxiellaceae bacterium]